MCNYTGKLKTQTGNVDYQCVRCERLYANLQAVGLTEYPSDQYREANKVYICPTCNAPHCPNCAINERCHG